MPKTLKKRQFWPDGFPGNLWVPSKVYLFETTDDPSVVYPNVFLVKWWKNIHLYMFFYVYIYIEYRMPVCTPQKHVVGIYDYQWSSNIQHLSHLETPEKPLWPSKFHLWSQHPWKDLVHPIAMVQLPLPVPLPLLPSPLHSWEDAVFGCACKPKGSNIHPKTLMDVTGSWKFPWMVDWPRSEVYEDTIDVQ